MDDDPIIAALRWCNDGPWYPNGPTKRYPGEGAIYAAEHEGLLVQDPMWRLTKAGGQRLAAVA